MTPGLFLSPWHKIFETSIEHNSKARKRKHKQCPESRPRWRSKSSRQAMSSTEAQICKGTCHRTVPAIMSFTYLRSLRPSTLNASAGCQSRREASTVQVRRRTLAMLRTNRAVTLCWHQSCQGAHWRGHNASSKRRTASLDVGELYSFLT